ncbi:MAG: ATP-binding cassette domain-containing protein [Deltaproteobacteria bacterium]|nr:ATP-binding cassette domain-containing protein [Deltaproteobacteria bacterium]
MLAGVSSHTPALDIAGVSFTYRGGDPALRGVDLTVAPGETVLVLGASGAGKSTLCLTTNGLIPQLVRGDFGGSVHLAGLDTREHPVRALALHAGLVFQDFESQLFCTTVELEAAFGPENLGRPRDEIRHRVTDALGRVGLGGYERRATGALSGGEKQRLAVASALSLAPSLLVFDEPTSDLDPAGKEEVYALARALGRERGAALLVAEPETSEAGAADRVLVLHEGTVALEGSPQEVLRRVPELRAAGIRPPAAAEVTERLGLTVQLDAAAAAEAIRAAGYRPRRGAARRSDMARGPAVLTARGLRYAYPGRPPALWPTDVTIHQGEFVAILGRNGSGKTTLAKLLAGILRPSDGVVEAPRAGSGVGFVFQNPDHQIFSETVEAEVAFGPRVRGMPEAEVSARVDEALEAVHLSSRRGNDPFLLSKGGRQRVAVASVLAMRPDVLILDEPTTGLDDREVGEMMDLISRLNAEGHTVVIVTHSMRVAAERSGRVVVMDGGRVLADGPTREVFCERSVLARAALKLPEAADLAERLGVVALGADELVAGLERG